MIVEDTDLDTAAHAMHASSANNLTLYFLYTSVSARKKRQILQVN